MTKVIDSVGLGTAIPQATHDANWSSVCGINESQTGTTYTVDINDQNRTIEISNASAVTVTLTLLSTIAAALHTDDFRVILKNIGAGVVTINTNAADTFDDTTTSITLNQYDCVEIQSSSTATIWNVIRKYVVDAATKTGTETLTNKTINGGATTLATPQASTSGTAIDFTSIPSWVKTITLMLNGVSTNGTNSLIVRLGDSGGFDTTGYDRGWVSDGSATSSSATLGMSITNNVVAADTYTGNVILSLLDSSTNTWVMTSIITSEPSSSGVVHYASCGHTLSGTLDRVRLTTLTADTFDAGKVNISYSG